MLSASSTVIERTLAGFGANKIASASSYARLSDGNWRYCERTRSKLSPRGLTPPSLFFLQPARATTQANRTARAAFPNVHDPFILTPGSQGILSHINPRT